MKRQIKNIKLYIKNTTYAKEVANDLKKKLVSNGYIINNQKYDLAISIGGDGTFLKMIHENKFNENLFYIGINAGSLGFLTDVEINNIDLFIKRLNRNEFTINENILVETKIITKKKNTKFLSVNELVIKKANQSLLKNKIYINNVLLENYVGDGILVCSPNGSTAYNLAFNGSIIDTDLKAMALVPIAPINNSIFKSLTNTLIISNNKKITIKFSNEENICIINDGIKKNINEVKEIRCEVSGKTIKLLNMSLNSLANKINNKIIG